MQSGILYGTSEAKKKNSNVTIAEWSDFLDFIETDNVPAFVFWGADNCSKCETYINKILRSTEFTAYIAGDGKNFAYFQAEGKSKNTCNKTVYDFVKGSNGKFPFIKLYWKKSDSQEVSKDISRGTDTYAGNDPAKLISDINSTFSGYSPKTKYTLSYSSNGGSGTVPASQTADSGTAITLSSSKLTKTGYTHSGWTIDSKTYSFGASYTLKSTVIAAAAWTKIDTTPDTPSEPATKEYTIPVFDPTTEQIPDAKSAEIHKESDFPLYHTYESTGVKYARLSENVNQICIRGELQNGVQSQLKAAYLNKRITEISPSCFMNCSQLTAVNADNSVTTVDDYAFYGCTALKGLSFLGPENKVLTRIGEYAFAKSGLESIKINHKGSVDDSAMHSGCFASCDNLEQVEFTNSTYLGDHMFDGCKKLSKVILNNYHSYVSEYCFANCPSLVNISLPAKTYMISPHMFEGCTNLTAVNFADDAILGECGDCAFAGCSKLTSITLPESVSSLNFIDPTFLSGSSIKQVTFKGIDDEYLTTTKKVSTQITYTAGKIYTTDLKNLIECAEQNYIPVVAWLGSGYDNGCDRCDNLYNNVIVPLSDWFAETNYLYAAGEYKNSSKEYSALRKFLKAADLEVPGKWAYVYLYWHKSDGTIAKWTSGSISPDTSFQQQLKDKMTELFDGYVGAEETTYDIKESITTFGRGTGQSVTYISKTGQEYVCSNDKVDFIPETKVDRTTTDDFRYGIWYYNARQLKDYADQHNLPVMFEYSSSACEPCRNFRKQTFANQTFQAEIKKRPCLFCRVEIGEGEYFDHPTTTQAYYLTHTFNKENTLIPCLIYYWKKADGTVTQTAWNYNYRTDPANANYQTVLSKLDAMLGDYAGESQYWPPAICWSDNEKFQYYKNEANDDTGRYFICDKKTPKLKYEGTLDIDLDYSGAKPAGDGSSSGSSGSSSIILTGLEVSAIVSIPDYTYQYYTTSGSDAQYNTNGVIFKVDNCSVDYICEFENTNDAIPDSAQAGYETGRSYSVESVTGFDEIVSDCRSNSKLLIILESGAEKTDFDKVIASSGFQRWLKRSEYLMIEIRQDSWDNALGKAVRKFETDTAFHDNSVSDPLPKLLVYHGCTSCTVDGRLVLYCRRKIAIVASKGYDYYTDLIDKCAEESESE